MTQISITVIDSIMGSGKTTWAIQYINEHPELSFIYITPFLDEVQRIKDACPDAHFREPVYQDGRKLNSFNSLILSGENIVSTHSTFTNANAQTIEYLQGSNYVLILDEVLDVLTEFNKLYPDQKDQQVSKTDLKLLFDKGLITVDEYGVVQWSDDNSYLGGKFSEVEKLSKNKTLLCINDTLLVWEFPFFIFNLFCKTIVMTYLYRGSVLKPYFEYHGIPVELKGITCNNGRYELTEYINDTCKRKELQPLIRIVENKKLNDYRNRALSKSWYIRAKAEDFSQLKKNLHNYFANIVKVKSEDIIWTCPKSFQNKLRGAGYINVRQMSKEERKLPVKERESLQKRLSCFVPCNARATNDFGDRSVLAYCCNMYCNPFITRYFELKSAKDHLNIGVNQDYYALSCLLQWIWRSRIRNGEPITVYIPSERMRKLFINWLQGDIA